MNSSLYLVAGLGKTGLSVARYLQRKQQSFIAFDTRANPPGLEEFETAFPKVKVYLEHLPAEVFNQLTHIVASPGLALDIPLLQEARAAGKQLYGDIECLVREITAPVIAITGTNGKSTVTTLVGEMAKAAGLQVAVAGNIGAPVLDVLDDGHQYDLWVLELSSFQLDLIHSLKPLASTILNITPDHLDRHLTLEAYVQAKQRIYQETKLALFNRGDKYTLPKDSNTSAVSFGIDVPEAGQWGLGKKDNAVWLLKGERYFLPVNDLLIKGVHNWLNALAACALAEAANIPEAVIIQVLRAFIGLSHRCQWVRTLDGVEWINDSKGTNIGATVSAIYGIGNAMQGKIVLIAGGQGKGADFNDLAEPIAQYVRSMVLIGEDADKIASALDDIVPIDRADSLEEAVFKAKLQAKPGDVVLLSPACASLDMFRDFNHRGDVFADSVRGLT